MSIQIIDELNKRLKDTTTSLSPIFGSLRIEGKRPTATRYKAKSLSSLENLVLDENDGKTEGAFAEDEKRLAALGDYSRYHFLQKYGSRVPSAGKTDVSFFDNWRIQNIKDNDTTVTKWLLIKGDLMGIQDFIYGDIAIENPGASRQLAKKLRGKSFFISVLTDYLAELFLYELDLPMSHLLFAGGGHFNLLVPFDKKGMVETVSQHLNKTLRQKYKQKINLIVATVECEKDIFDKANGYMKAVNEERDKLKYQPHRSYLSAIFKEKPTHTEGSNFVKIGGIVPKSKYLVQVINDGQFPQEVKNEKRHAKLIDLPTLNNKQVVSLWTVRDTKAVKSLLEQISNVQSVNIISLNEFDFLKVSDRIGQVKYDFPIDYGFRLVGKAVPMSKKETEEDEEGSPTQSIADFEEIADLSFEFSKKSVETLTPLVTDKEGKYKPIYGKLSAVRLDIDDLGFIFSSGFGIDSSLERIAALSRELNLFFSGYINYLADKYGIYIVYSGGDDAFVVGNWKAMLLFMAELNTDFKKFVGNEAVHFSAGVFMCDAHFPVQRFAEESETLQGVAKNHDESRGKNHILVFNNPMNWEAYQSTLEFAEKILICTEGDEKLTRSLLFRVLTLIRNGYHEREVITNGVRQKVGSINMERFYRNVSGLHYLFARHGFTQEKIERAQDMITKDVIKVILGASKNNDDKKTLLKNCTVALQYAILTLRESKN